MHYLYAEQFWASVCNLQGADVTQVAYIAELRGPLPLLLAEQSGSFFCAIMVI
jgi:hypothetical protein